MFFCRRRVLVFLSYFGCVFFVFCFFFFGFFLLFLLFGFLRAVTWNNTLQAAETAVRLHPSSASSLPRRSTSLLRVSNHLQVCNNGKGDSTTPPPPPPPSRQLANSPERPRMCHQTSNCCSDKEKGKKYVEKKRTAQCCCFSLRNSNWKRKPKYQMKFKNVFSFDDFPLVPFSYIFVLKGERKKSDYSWRAT